MPSEWHGGVWRHIGARSAKSGQIKLNPTSRRIGGVDARVPPSGVARRSINGLSASAHAATLGERIPFVVRLGWCEKNLGDVRSCQWCRDRVGGDEQRDQLVSISSRRFFEMHRRALLIVIAARRRETRSGMHAPTRVKESVRRDVSACLSLCHLDCPPNG